MHVKEKKEKKKRRRKRKTYQDFMVKEYLSKLNTNKSFAKGVFIFCGSHHLLLQIKLRTKSLDFTYDEAFMDTPHREA